MINAMIIDAKDDVVVAIEPITAGDTVSYLLDGKEAHFAAVNDVTIYHKIARRDITKGSMVSKYGQHIGMAACDIKTGEHVHTHNMESKREDLHD